MNVDFAKYARGTVWFCRNNDKTTKKGVQAHSRPALIISNNYFNCFSPAVNVVFLSTKQKNNPVHIHISNIGHNNTSTITDIKSSDIMIEQIATVNVSDLISYMFTVSDDIMRKVEEAIKLQFSLSAYDDTNETTVDNEISEITTKPIETPTPLLMPKALSPTDKIKNCNCVRYTKEDYDFMMQNYPHNWVLLKNKYHKNNKIEVAKMVSYVKGRFKNKQ